MDQSLSKPLNSVVSPVEVKTALGQLEKSNMVKTEPLKVVEKVALGRVDDNNASFGSNRRRLKIF